MKYKTIKAIGLALKAKVITEEEAIKAYKLLKVNKETQKLVKQLNAAANTVGFKRLGQVFYNFLFYTLSIRGWGFLCAVQNVVWQKYVDKMLITLFVHSI